MEKIRRFGSLKKVAAIALGLVFLIPYGGHADAATQAQKFAFCKKQKSICKRYCKEKRGNDGNCINACDGRMSTCTNTGCYYWSNISAVAQWGAQSCIN